MTAPDAKADTVAPARWRLSPTMTLMSCMGAFYVFALAALFLGGLVAHVFKYANNGRMGIGTYSLLVGAAVISLGCVVLSCLFGMLTRRILKNAKFSNARIEGARTYRLGGRDSTELYKFRLSLTDEEGETWQANYDGGVRGEHLSVGDWVEAVYDATDRELVMIADFIPGKPVFGDDGVVRPRSLASVYGFVAIGAACFALWLTAFFL